MMCILIVKETAESQLVLCQMIKSLHLQKTVHSPYYSTWPDQAQCFLQPSEPLRECSNCKHQK